VIDQSESIIAEGHSIFKIKVLYWHLQFHGIFQLHKRFFRLLKCSSH